MTQTVHILAILIVVSHGTYPVKAFPYCAKEIQMSMVKQTR